MERKDLGGSVEYCIRPKTTIYRRLAAAGFAAVTLAAGGCDSKPSSAPNDAPILELPKESAPTPGKPIYLGDGDSYSGGEGAPVEVVNSEGKKVRTYLTGTNTPEDHCHRSIGAYPVEVWKGLGPGWGLDFRACSGAT